MSKTEDKPTVPELLSVIHNPHGKQAIAQRTVCMTQDGELVDESDPRASHVLCRLLEPVNAAAAKDLGIETELVKKDEELAEYANNSPLLSNNEEQGADWTGKYAVKAEKDKK